MMTAIALAAGMVLPPDCYWTRPPTPAPAVPIVRRKPQAKRPPCPDCKPVKHHKRRTGAPIVPHPAAMLPGEYACPPPVAAPPLERFGLVPPSTPVFVPLPPLRDFLLPPGASIPPPWPRVPGPMYIPPTAPFERPPVVVIPWPVPPGSSWTPRVETPELTTVIEVGTVPEPGSWSLVVIGVAALALRRT